MGIGAWLTRLFGGVPSAPLNQNRSQAATVSSVRLAQARTPDRQQQNWAASNYDDYIHPENPEREFKIKVNAWIRYRDTKGQESRRAITTNKLVEEGGKTYLHAYCYLRQANRTFNASQILEFVDGDSGEVICDPVAYLTERFEQTPIGRIQKVIDGVDLEVRCLVFVARADGSVRNKQKAVISEYLNRLSAGLNCSGDDITGVVQGLHPSQTEYRKALKALQAKPTEDRRALIESLEEMAATRNTNNEFGKSAVAVAIKALR